MGKLQVFQISFSENRSVYFPGDIIIGQLHVQLSSSMDMTEIRLKFVGKAHVSWTESSGSGKNRHSRRYSANESLFEQAVIVFGKGASASENRKTLPQGSHSFPFQFQLPLNLPSTFEDHIGHIRYFMKATINRPWKFDKDTKAAFTVLDVLDLNALSNMISPSGGSSSKTLCCMCCSSGPIELNFYADRTGYVPGEWITLNANITNSSNSDVEGTSAELIQTVVYHATSKTKSISKTLNKVMGSGCGPHGNLTWTNERIHIPPLPPSESAHCRIIDIHYSVKFTVQLRAFAVNLRESAPVIIGTVPLRSLEMYNRMPAGDAQGPSAPLVSPPLATNAAISTSDATAPPPSYASATGDNFTIKDDDDNDYTMGDMNYAPQYTYYDWSQSAFTYN